MVDQNYKEGRIIEILEISEMAAANFQKRIWLIKVRVHSEGEELETTLSRIFQFEAESLKVGDTVLL